MSLEALFLSYCDSQRFQWNEVYPTRKLSLQKTQIVQSLVVNLHLPAASFLELDFFRKIVLWSAYG